MPANKEQKGKTKPEEKKLTDKQELFCREYVKDLNATKAAERAGYSEKTAKDIAAQNLAKLNIKSRIAELQAQKLHRIDVSADKVMQEMAICGFYNPADYFKIVNRRVPVKEGDKIVRRLMKVAELRDDISREAWAAVASIKQGPHGIEVRFHDKTKNLELLGKHLDFFFVDRVDHTTAGQAITNAPDYSKLDSEEKLAYLRMLKKMRG